MGSHVCGRIFNEIARDRTRYQWPLDGLLINGLEVRVLPGSPLKLKHLRESGAALEKLTVAETVAGAVCRISWLFVRKFQEFLSRRALIDLRAGRSKPHRKNQAKLADVVRRIVTPTVCPNT
jgi:hypothetical protein